MFETTNHLFLLLEYSSGMDMYQWISMRSDRTDPVSGSAYTPTTRLTVIKSVFDQVLEGVSQVHHCGVAHRDLKPENFLIEHADGQYTVKITDFGLATTDMESDEFECGSKPYMSYGMSQFVVHSFSFSFGSLLPLTMRDLFKCLLPVFFLFNRMQEWRHTVQRTDGGYLVTGHHSHQPLVPPLPLV